MSVNIEQAKRAARTLARELADAHNLRIAHGQALELVARQLGYANWNTASARLEDPSLVPTFGGGVPVLRVQEAALAYPFYLDFLGFVREWEHRFEPGMPVYARIRRGDTVLDLSEHHGDGTPGSVVWIPVADVAGLRRELVTRPTAPVRPGIDADAPGGPTLTVIDPYGNTLRFCQPE